MEINSEMELLNDSPVKKEKKNKNVKRPKSCIIHVDQTADDSTLSGFTEQSWKVIFYAILFLFHNTFLKNDKYSQVLNRRWYGFFFKSRLEPVRLFIMTWIIVKKCLFLARRKLKKLGSLLTAKLKNSP